MCFCLKTWTADREMRSGRWKERGGRGAASFFTEKNKVKALSFTLRAGGTVLVAGIVFILSHTAPLYIAPVARRLR